MRDQYVAKLTKLESEIIDMGAMAEKILDMAVNALINKDIKLAKKVIEFEKTIDEKEISLEEQCLEMIILQQPFAKDLRRITAAIKMVNDLERIGDLCENIAEIVIEIGEEKFIKPLVDLPKMAEITKDMIKKSLDAFSEKDAELAKEVLEMDDRIDELNIIIDNDLIEILKIDTNAMRQAVDLMFVARYIERIADHVTNICEHVIYVIEGRKNQKK